MPYVRRRRTSYQRRYARRANGYVRNRYRRKGRMMMSRAGGRNRFGSMIARNPITSDTLFVKLRFSELRTVGGSTGVNTSYVYRGNDIRDPNFTGTGGSVSGATQWFGLYTDVVVLGSKIKLGVVNGAAQIAQCCVYPNRNSTPVGTSVSDLREIPYGRTRTLHLYSSGAQNGPQNVTNYFSTAKMYTVAKQEVKDNQLYWHQSGTDPSNQWFWIMEIDWAASVTTSYQIDATITYYCMFKRRANVQL